jgi:hypothetical protein
MRGIPILAQIYFAKITNVVTLGYRREGRTRDDTIRHNRQSAVIWRRRARHEKDKILKEWSDNGEDLTDVDWVSFLRFES